MEGERSPGLGHLSFMDCIQQKGQCRLFCLVVYVLFCYSRFPSPFFMNLNFATVWFLSIRVALTPIRISACLFTDDALHQRKMFVVCFF